MSTFQIGEVVETKKAYKTKQKDENNNILYNGSLLVRVGAGHSYLGQVRTVWAAPANFNRRMPLIGEQVLIFTAPGTETSSEDFKQLRWFYTTAYNAVDDVTSHQFPKDWTRSSHNKGSKPASPGLNDRKEVGYTIDKNIGGTKPLQPFEGDDLWEGRFGQSIRFSRHFQMTNAPGPGIYEKQPTWKGSSKNDPILIIRVKKPEKGSSYDIEDLKKDDASIYLTTKHKLLNLKVGFKRNRDAIKIPTYSGGPQLVLDSDRIVINAKKDFAFLIAKKETVTTAEQVLMQSKRYRVYLDDLMDWLDDLAKQFWKLASAQATYTTMMGPTGIASNVAEITKIHKVNFQKYFKVP